MGAPTDLTPLYKLGEARKNNTDEIWEHYKYTLKWPECKVQTAQT